MTLLSEDQPPSSIHNLLFICSKNQWRSPTAEQLFKEHNTYRARSAGTSAKARVRVTDKLLAWADVVFVMEKKHKERLHQDFPLVARSKKIMVLFIPDDYPFNDPALIDLLKEKLQKFL